MDEQARMTCGDCRHFHRHGNGVEAGYCYAEPPAIFIGRIQMRPEVKMAERECGLFKPGTPTEYQKTNPDTPAHAVVAARVDSKKGKR